jgi:hypothetical protein
MRTKKYSKEDLIDAVSNSKSIRQTLIKLNVSPHGGNYRVIKNNIKELNIDTSHFTGHGWNKGKKFGPKRPIEDYLSNKHKISSHALRLRLLKEGFFEHKCYKCNLETWNDKPIPLELEHKDGKNSNNSIENLTLLCPNCHAQTKTYRGRNISK